jgi:two-component system sensor kinase FixL
MLLRRWTSARGAKLAVEAELAAGADQVVVRVIDTDPGLAPEVAERLFQPFVTTKAQGTGVGLSICRSIIEGHGGVLTAKAIPGVERCRN